MMKHRPALWFALLLLVLLCAALWPHPSGQAQPPYPLQVQRMAQDTRYLTQEIGPRPAGTPQERLACDWLQAELEAAGFSPAAGTLQRTEFTGLEGVASENLTATCNAGSDGPLFSILAHYDSVAGSPGARDNAAAVACLLEIARLLGPQAQDFPCEIRLVFLGSEENGYHGSAAYVSALSPQERVRHQGAFNMDISAAAPEEGAVLVCNTLGGVTEEGGYREGDFLSPVDNTVSSALADAYQTLYQTQLPVFHVGESDHVSFHLAGLDAANLCWRRIQHDLPVLPDTYHAPEDTWEALDFSGTALVSGQCILTAIAQLSQSSP